MDITSNQSGPVVIGDFRIERRIGAGGMGIVYLATQMSLNRLVALKVLGDRLKRPGDKARFQREAQAVAKLKHPNIASVYFIGQDNRLCYIAMEYIDGISLREFIDRLARTTKRDSSLEELLQSSVRISEDLERFDTSAETVISDDSIEPDSQSALTPEAEYSISTTQHIRRCCEIVRDATDALAHAHGQGVIHRDLKPDNLMLSRGAKVHIIDFGIAKFVEDATLTQTGQLVGTPLYMSPEQVTGRINLDHRTDIYSLGLVLYELLTLVPPITAPTREGVLRKIVTKTLTPVSWQNVNVPSDLENVVHKAASKDPDCRSQSAQEFAEDVQRFLDGKSVVAQKLNYRLDDSEISAARPTRVIFVAFVLFLAGLPGAFFCFHFAFDAIWQVFDFAFDPTWKWSTAKPFKNSVLGKFYVLSTLVLSYPASFTLLKGYSRGWWGSASMFCFALAWYALYLGENVGLIEMINSTVLYYWLPVGLFIGGLVILFTKRTRDWFHFAKQVRAEQQSYAVRKPTTKLR